MRVPIIGPDLFQRAFDHFEVEGVRAIKGGMTGVRLEVADGVDVYSVLANALVGAFIRDAYRPCCRRDHAHYEETGE